MSDSKIVKFGKPKNKSTKLSQRGLALYREGACFDDAGKDKLALEKYLLSEKEGYDSADLYASIARLYNVFEDYPNAIKYAQMAIDTDDTYGYPYYLMGGACYELGRYKESLKNYLLAEKNGLDYSVVMFRDISDVYTKTEPDNIMKQLEYATKAISLDPEDSYSYYWKGWIYYNANEYKQAVKYYEKAEEMGYYSFSYYYEISYAYTMLGNLKKALDYANKCIFIDKDDNLGYYRKGWAYYNIGDYSKAKPLFLTAEKKNCTYADMYTSLGYIYQLEKNFDLAVEYCNKAIKLDKNDPDGYSQLGNIYASLKNDFKTAIKYYKKAYKKNKDFNENFYLNYGMLYYMRNYHCIAIKIFEEGLKKFPRNYDLNAAYIASLQMKKEYKKAFNLTKKLVRLEPDNPWNNYNLALSYYNQKSKDRNYDKVIEYTEKIDNEEMLINGGCYGILSFACYEKKNYDKSLEYFLKFFETNTEELFIQKNYKEIRRYYKKLIKKFPQNKKLATIGEQYKQYLKQEAAKDTDIS